MLTAVKYWKSSSERGSSVQMPEPSRFLFEHEISAVASGREHSIVEVEISVPTDYVGEFDYEHFRIGIWDVTYRQSEQKLYFRGAALHHSGAAVEEQPGNFYHGGGALDELLHLFTLHFGSTFTKERTVRVNDRPSRSLRSGMKPKVEKPKQNLKHAELTVKLARNLPSDKKLRFLLALKFHSLGLRQYHSDPELAFISFISAIEAVASGHDREEAIGLDNHLSGLLDKVSDIPLQIQIRKVLFQRSSVKRKVLAFFLDHTTDEFWESPERPEEEYLRVPKADFPDLIKRMYDARSRYLHEGIPPPPPLFRTVNGAEICPTLATQVGTTIWERSDYLPHLSFIARLVNSNLCEYLRKNQSAN